MFIDYQLFIFKIKKYIKLILLCCLIIYSIFLPLSIYNAQNSFFDYTEPSIICFSFMQKYLYIVMIIYISIMNKEYIDIKCHDIVYSVDKRIKLRHFIYCTLFYNFILIPFYIVVYMYIDNMEKYIICFVMQTYVVCIIYYFIAMVVRNNMLSIGLMCFYILVFSLFYLEKCIGNIFIFENTINFSWNPNIYLLELTIYFIIFMILGIFFEGRFGIKK